MSDKLLNGMYNKFKEDYFEELFEKVKKTQIKWVNQKLELEKSSENNQLEKYQRLNDIISSKCEEWNVK